MSYHGWAVIRQANVSAQVYVNVSDWAEPSGRQWSGNFESAPSAPPLLPGEAVLEAGDSQPAPITITSPEITSHNPVVYDGDFTGHGNPPSIIEHRTPRLVETPLTPGDSQLVVQTRNESTRRAAAPGLTSRARSVGGYSCLDAGHVLHVLPVSTI